MGIHDLWLFLAAGFMLNLTPGPDMALIVARSAQQGARAGVAAALGVGLGAFVHIAAAAIGVSAVVMSSALAFSVLKWAGATYLVYLGVRMLRASLAVGPDPAATPAPPAAALRSIFWQGALTNALNPKVAIFFLAFLPQFVDAEAPSKVVALLTLGLIFNLVGTAWNVAVGCFAARIGRAQAFRRGGVWLERAIGGFFVALGLRLAFAERG